MTLPDLLAAALSDIEPAASFDGPLPKVTSSISHKSYYAKLGTSDDSEQYIGEAESLKILEKCSAGLGPKLLTIHVDEETSAPIMISEYLDFSGGLTSSSEVELARRLATEVHACGSDQGFGFAVPTYCGPTRFGNGWYSSWDECFGDMVKSMLDRIEAKSHRNLTQLVEVGREIQSRYDLE